MQRIEGGATAAKGFEAAATEANIKYAGRTDMALLFSQAPCVTAGTFTTNVVKAAPVIWDRDLVYSGVAAHAVVVNSGIANACTGEEGMRYCRETAQEAAACLQIPENSVLVGSTGVIGFQLPIDRIRAGVRALAAAKKPGTEAGTEAAKAIMTTDTVDKQAAYCVQIGGVPVTVGGMAKGSGMIHPNMCTMLAYVTTDAAIEKSLLQRALSGIVQDTFNMISVDGDTSTNDTLLVLANGLAGNPLINDEDSEEYRRFREVLFTVCRELSMKMAADGEGCTKLIEMNVTGADTKRNARILAKSVVTSSLTKAAMYGRDANWGRILCALGYAGVEFDPNRCDLYFGEGDDRILIFTDGSAADYSEEEATLLLSGERVVITADLHMGDAEATAWGCDLTCDYVKINADYRS
ncbi:MAG: bifunctional glutamate N-acetyltransferase/amino-acid acetyltransferase ArgJ [Eubacteriales bacterium]|nr:bifunctional glutamate N-acetyltransferase/amino-acid acetyltransferase ArgJ [Eubacteriales bacterium]